MIAGVLLAALVAGPPAPVEHRGQTVFVTWDVANRACVPKVNGVETGDVQSETGKAALVAALPDHGAALRLMGTADIPYVCTDAIVTTLRTSGYYGGIALTAQPVLPAGR